MICPLKTTLTNEKSVSIICMLGVFAQGESTNGVADFDWFEYK